MIRRPPRSTRTATLVPSTTLFLSRRQSRDVGPVADHAAFAWRDQPRDDVQQRGLAAAGRAEQRIGAAILPDMIEALQRSEEHTSELQSLMRHSYAVFCLKKQKLKQEKDNKDPQRA